MSYMVAFIQSPLRFGSHICPPQKTTCSRHNAQYLHSRTLSSCTQACIHREPSSDRNLQTEDSYQPKSEPSIDLEQSDPETDSSNEAYSPSEPTAEDKVQIENHNLEGPNHTPQDGILNTHSESLEETLLPADNSWYSVVETIAKPDVVGNAIDAENNDEVLDLKAIDDAGRKILAQSSYESVVDVNVDKGGVLEADEDNNDLFSGVGFDALIDTEELLTNLREELGIETTTHVQLAAIPRISEGCDIVMQSYTGTGKTLAYLLPIIDEMDITEDITKAMIIAPTRELAMQIAHECEKLTRGMAISTMALIGGANPARQVERLRKVVPHITVGTPGRLAELAETGELRARRVERLVIDEVDQCLTREFSEHVRRILREVPRAAQKILVSATGDVDAVRAFSGELLRDPILLRVGGALRIPRNIQHWMCIVPARLKIDTVRKIMFSNPLPERAIVFVDDPRRVDIVGERLWQMKIAVGALRGNAHKMERKEVLEAFRKGKVKVLVSTEVAARGLDIPEITHVINLDLPTDMDHYVHRAGRCGRAGRAGVVISITTTDRAFILTRLSKNMDIEIRRMEPRGGEYSETIQQNPQTRKPITQKKVGETNGKILDRRKEKLTDKTDKRTMRLNKETNKRTETTNDKINKRMERFSDDLNASVRKPSKQKANKAKGKRNTSDSGNGQESQDEKSPKNQEITREQRIASLVLKRKKRNIARRAQIEGWVGNRPAE